MTQILPEPANNEKGSLSNGFDHEGVEVGTAVTEIVPMADCKEAW
jgi:hypothetical protein